MRNIHLILFSLSIFELCIALPFISSSGLLGLLENLIKREESGGMLANEQYYDVNAAPIGALPPRTAGDAPWTRGEISYQRKIVCPFGIQNKAKGIVMLVPGTSGNASETYMASPYYQTLPSRGFDVCWVDTPNYSLSDMQLSAEFIAYGIKYLAPKSTQSSGKINIVSYSQGGANVQWASTFWPSVQNLVLGHVALAPSMKGTTSSIMLCSTSDLAGGCQPAIIQQTMGSNYMNAANSLIDAKSAAYALIPSTIIYTTSDEIVTPQVGQKASSRLIGASNIGLQQICPLSVNVDHLSMPGDVGVYGIALDALLNGRPAQASTVDRSYCTRTAQSLGFQNGNAQNNLNSAFRTVIGDQRGGMVASQFQNMKTTQEPLLQQYVCDRGYATGGCTRNGFSNV